MTVDRLALTLRPVRSPCNRKRSKTLSVRLRACLSMTTCIQSSNFKKSNAITGQTPHFPCCKEASILFSLLLSHKAACFRQSRTNAKNEINKDSSFLELGSRRAATGETKNKHMEPEMSRICHLFTYEENSPQHLLHTPVPNNKRL